MTITQSKIVFGAILGVVGIGAAAVLPKVVAQRRQEARKSEIAGLQQNTAWQAAARRFGKENVSAAALFARADRVQVFRLYPVSDGKETPRGKLRGDVPFYAEAKPQGADFAARLGAIVLNPRSYRMPGNSIKQCYMNPGVGYRVWSGKQFADIILCFECSQLVVLEDNPKLPERGIGGWILGRFAVAGDFDGVRPELAALAKKSLPDDAQVQKL